MMNQFASLDDQGRIQTSPEYSESGMSDRWFKFLFDSSDPLDILVQDPFLWVFMGRYSVDPSQLGLICNGNDYVRFSVVDVDGLYAPPGTVLDTLAEEYLVDSAQWVVFRPARREERFSLVPGLYMRCELMTPGHTVLPAAKGVITLGLSRQTG